MYQMFYNPYQWYFDREKILRRKFNAVGWTLVIYYLIMNVAVMATMVIDMLALVLRQMAENPDMTFDERLLTEDAVNNGWGYLVAAGIGLFILLVWKGKNFWTEKIWAKGSAMTAGAFFGILSVFIGIQAIASLMSTVLELILNGFGLSMMSILESTSGQSDGLSMFLYGSICAPITEEILFRGYVQRTLEPYGKKFAIFGSALLFGLFHGNLIQTPYAFLVGLVLGYVTAEYNVAWAMVLHMLNNMVLADLLSRVTAGLPAGVPDLITNIVIWGFGIAAVVILIVKRKKIAAYLRRERMDRQCLECFFCNAGVITLTVLMLINLVLLITPI